VKETALQAAYSRAIDTAAVRIRADEDAAIEVLRLKKRRQAEIILLLML